MVEHAEGLEQTPKVDEICEKDYEIAAQLIRETIAESWKGIRSDELIGDFLAKYTTESIERRAHEGKLWLATDEATGQPLGVIGLKGHELRTFFVHPRAQGRGIGRLLFERLKAEAIRQGLTKLSLEGSEVGQPVYEKFGFRKVGAVQKQRHGQTYEDAVMELDLSDEQSNA